LAQADLKAKELKQQQDKQQSLNAVQSERRRQQEEKSQMQANLQAASNRASVAEGQRSALEQRSAQLQQELDGVKARLAASERALAECRAQQDKPGAPEPDVPHEQVGCTSRVSGVLHNHAAPHSVAGVVSFA
jgi:ABC-type phosphate transport system auxiliary subunit